MTTFATTGTDDMLPRMMRDLTKRAINEGFAERELTASVELLAQD